MTYINKTNASRNIAGTRDFVAWGKEVWSKDLKTLNIRSSISALVFAGVLIVCSLTVGCSKDKNGDHPRTVTANNEISTTPTVAPVAATPAPTIKADNKSAVKKVVRKRPATVNYTDKTYGVAFEYPRRYAIETGEAATELLTSSPVPMNFVQPGGVALAAVELPETAYTNTDFSSAFFNVSVHKGLTADQCTEFAVPAPVASTQTVVIQKDEPAPVASTSSNETAKPEVSPAQTASNETPSTQAASSNETKPAADQSTTNQSAVNQTTTEAAAATSTTASSQPNVDPKSEQKSDSNPDTTSDVKADAKSEGKSDSNAATVAQSDAPVAKPSSPLTLSDLKMHGTEAVSGEGTRQSDSKYFHVYQNGACYEFGMNVTTNASGDGITKHVDRDKVFASLEKMLATVKFDEVKPSPATPETAEAPKTAAIPEGHMQ
jgi:heme/copper-type cytochrome/quinol oxidase subunit 2